MKGAFSVNIEETKQKRPEKKLVERVILFRLGHLTQMGQLYKRYPLSVFDLKVSVTLAFGVKVVIHWHNCKTHGTMDTRHRVSPARLKT